MFKTKKLSLKKVYSFTKMFAFAVVSTHFVNLVMKQTEEQRGVVEVQAEDGEDGGGGDARGAGREAAAHRAAFEGEGHRTRRDDGPPSADGHHQDGLRVAEKRKFKGILRFFLYSEVEFIPFLLEDNNV